MRHPNDVLFSGEKPFPILPAVDHYAGSEKLMRKALALQQQFGPVFDVTCDCEDGAAAGAEAEHARMAGTLIASDENLHGRVGARIHDITHAHWQEDIELLIAAAGHRLAFLTLPKARGVADVSVQIDALRAAEVRHATGRSIPVHVLIETHGALREVWEIAALPGVESIDFGLMDFVSAHRGAIPASAMTSPGQFEHPLIVRAKSEIAAAALANGIVPAHNVTTELTDLALIRADAERARNAFGFLRMWSIHPNQIVPIVEAMRPDYSAVETASEILCAAQDADWGPVRHQGKLHDRASYRYWWELLERAQVAGMTLPALARQRFFALQ
ncbi:HpcH/HpaI aldolase/citrate lyase family protein [Rhodocyclus tenuis]|uniref:HpcH/HpaI aldolase/citrate lyase family protein n=1 Tax=Rhodocyclus tenuis TaxID=1066 RepID=UPI001906A4C9|nr:aldolase/citrate lyase family protein [Rhodocyclus tenuis]MBK1679530.1 CoA ester lyase [Rhodocyclus tenuis]